MGLHPVVHLVCLCLQWEERVLGIELAVSEIQVLNL